MKPWQHALAGVALTLLIAAMIWLNVVYIDWLRS